LFALYGHGLSHLNKGFLYLAELLDLIQPRHSFSYPPWTVIVATN
jgi:hypothetical protein